MELKQISLKQMLPRVFISENIPDSQIWKSDVTFDKGCYYLVEATSGGGKSSMCAYIFGSRTDFEGELLFNGENSSTLSPSQWQELRRNNIAYLPQELSLFPELTARENIMLKNNLTGHVNEDKINYWLRSLGIDSRSDYPVGKMSIGQQQRVAIIRSICQPFDFILLDEPVSHLDQQNNRIAAEIIVEEARRQKAGIITTSVGNHLLIDEIKRLAL